MLYFSYPFHSFIKSKSYIMHEVLISIALTQYISPDHGTFSIYFQSDTSSKKDERADSISGGEDEQDLNSFSHILESDITPLPHFSTPVSNSSPQETATPQYKRPMKPPQNNTTLKRAKPTSESSVQNPKARSPPSMTIETPEGPVHEEEEGDYIEGPLCFKMESLEQEEQRQFLESNGNGNVAEPSVQDQGRFFSLFLHVLQFFTVCSAKADLSRWVYFNLILMCFLYQRF